MERYLERTGRIVAALASLGRPCDDGVLELLHAEAAVTLTIFEAAPDNLEQQNARLQEEFAIQFLEIDGTAGQFVKIQALENVMMRRGMDPTRIRRDLTVGDPTSVGGAEFSEQDGGARPLGTAASAGRTLPPFPTGTGQAQTFELTPPKDLTLEARSQDAEIERLRKIVQQQEAEKAAARLLQPPLMSANPSGQATPVTTGDLAAVLDKQTELLAEVIKRNNAPRLQSTIKVEPRVQWPKLTDDTGGGREVEEFYEKFEGIVMLANNGQGMPDKEMLIALKQCISGSRLLIYDNVMKQMKPRLEEEGGHAEAYKTIKARFFKFLETGVERQLRVRNEWMTLSKGKNMNAIQFEAAWERAHANMVEVGLPVSATEKFIAYIQKVGPYYAERVRLDRRSRTDGAGGTTVRIPETWEECHEVLCELDSVKAGERAFNAARAAGQEMQTTGTQGSPDKSKKEVKLEKQLEKAKEQLKAAGQKGKGKGKM